MEGEREIDHERGKEKHHPLVLWELPPGELQASTAGPSDTSSPVARSLSLTSPPEPEGSHIRQPVPALTPSRTICLGRAVTVLLLTGDVLQEFFSLVSPPLHFYYPMPDYQLIAQSLLLFLLEAGGLR
ncbi:unnamed protein product [Pleuronectes platessa]|uniref:Uncharacterized protein n=1 Tax=Pleuronectes platessa TaxID=8262 RepID=A0A9N7ZCU7_PLEPL|nr:unnamed protein product [Pleuronectes platessa]